jgi:hypothetical protein
VKDDADLRATIVALIPNTRVAAIVPLPAGPRAQTYRADVIAGGRSQTWFIKHFPDPSDHATQEFHSYERLRGVVGVTPTVIAADTQRRVLIVEYLSNALDLFVALRRSTDPLKVARELGRLTARLGTATCQPPPSVDDVAIHEQTALAAAWPKVEAWAGELGVPTTAGMHAAIAAVLDRWAHPTKASLTQGDPAPGNVVFLPDGQARLVDFEYGAQRHVLADLAQWWIRCPLPEQWFEAIVEEVRTAFIGSGIYADGEAFDDDLAHIAAYAAMYMFTWLPIKQTLAEDPPWVGAWRARHALLSSSSRGMRAARSAPQLSPLADWLDTVNGALSRAWPASGDGAPDWNALVGKGG